MTSYLNLANSHQVQLYIYFMLKYAMEIVLAESSVITGYYFIWSTSSVAIFLACLGLTVLPVNVVVGSYISNMFEERWTFKYEIHYIICYILTHQLMHISSLCWSDCRQVLLASEILVCIGILLSFHVLIPYSVPQYVSSALITFVSAEVLEGNSIYSCGRTINFLCIFLRIWKFSSETVF